MPHDQAIAIQALIVDRDRLRAENERLKTLLVTILRSLTEVQLNLTRALDKDQT